MTNSLTAKIQACKFNGENIETEFDFLEFGKFVKSLSDADFMELSNKDWFDRLFNQWIKFEREQTNYLHRRFQLSTGHRVKLMDIKNFICPDCKSNLTSKINDDGKLTIYCHPCCSNRLYLETFPNNMDSIYQLIKTSYERSDK